MTPPVLLTAPTTAPLDADPLGADCTMRAMPPLVQGFSVVLAHPNASTFTFTPTPTSPVPPPSTVTDGASALAFNASRPFENRALRQWSGAPMRATVPLPRRASKFVVPGGQNGDAAMHATPCQTRTARLYHGSDAGLVDGDWGEIEGEVDGGENQRDKASSGSRYCSYESITAAEGLSAWSFEELRVECYAQSLVARGSKPPPVGQPSLAIPPAFVPRIVPQS